MLAVNQTGSAKAGTDGNACVYRHDADLSRVNAFRGGVGGSVSIARLGRQFDGPSRSEGTCCPATPAPIPEISMLRYPGYHSFEAVHKLRMTLVFAPRTLRCALRTGLA